MIEIKNEVTPEVGNIVASYVKNTGGSFVKCHPIDGFTKIRCTENVLLEIQSNKTIVNKYDLNFRRVNRWWYLVAFIKK